MNQAAIEQFFLATDQRIQYFDEIHNKNSCLVNTRLNEVENTIRVQLQLMHQHLDSLKSDFQCQISAACETLKKELVEPVPMEAPKKQVSF
jgi:hypothetical protein